MEINIYQSNQVFTPTKPARLAFVERDSVQNRLVNALDTPGKQLVIYGHSGVGKTTLIVNKLYQTYSHHITTRCMKGMSFEQIIIDAFGQVEKYYCSEVNISKKENFSAKFSQEIINIKTEIGLSKEHSKGEKFTPILPPQLTPHNLGKFIGEIEACWVLEDFHKVDESEKQKISQLMKVFMDLSDEYSSLKIISIGAVNTARQVIAYDDEMRNRVSEILVPLMTDSEIDQIISHGEEKLNIKFPTDLRKQIIKHSSGMASICHALCLYMCRNAGINQTLSGNKYIFTVENWKKALGDLLEETSDTIKNSFEKALNQKRKEKYHHASIIIEAMCEFTDTGAGRIQILSKIKSLYPEYKGTKIKEKLDKLCSPENGGILKFNDNSGSYTFKDPIFFAYAQAMQKRSAQPVPSEDSFELRLIDLFKKYIGNDLGKFQFEVKIENSIDKVADSSVIGLALGR